MFNQLPSRHWEEITFTAPSMVACCGEIHWKSEPDDVTGGSFDCIKGARMPDNRESIFETM
ncbi:hypothetical protein ASPCADRAFT_205658 [Aspergillus carbonarius ITEM 5010]|uniref:Uncharacterized protein n=1 Tax=Aspergillus carbonarius (strain ITEM 5010) TaxID=602072 RepID=A0A1R3RVD9_ASPC5|nr:hypothetical protein ASPCADRAFT_205658 [Aspergillus carbonarius ITEM 5010]